MAACSAPTHCQTPCAVSLAAICSMCCHHLRAAAFAALATPPPHPRPPPPAVNTPDWCLVDAACHAYSMISVPLYDTLGPDTVKYICNHAELAAVACSLDVLGKMLEVLHECPTVRLVVSRERWLV